MNITLTLTWWIIPTVITVAGIIWALFVVEDNGYLGGITNLFALVPVLIISTIAWIVAGVLK